MRAITICVDYHDLLSLSLSWNAKQFKSITVITAPHCLGDTLECCRKYTNVDVMQTNLFYADGAIFNKFRALEWGLDRIGREGWMCHLDADTVIPQSLNLLDEVKHFSRGHLYTPLRRMCENLPSKGDQPYIPLEHHWQTYPVHAQFREWAGYCQIYHASDERLGTPPWHDITWTTAGGGDSFFQFKWPDERKVRPAWEVLHIGRAGVNWAGRTTPYIAGRKAGETPKESEERSATLRQLIRSRGKGADRFKGEKIVIPGKASNPLSEAFQEGEAD